MPLPTIASAEPDELDELAPSTRTRTARRNVALQKWSRLVHVYSSMVIFLLVLFFGVTGLTLNHPDWTFGLDAKTSTVTGTLPSSTDVNGKIDLLAVSQYLRAHDGVHGEIGDFGLNATQGFISYRAPGYSADATIDVAADTYKLSVEDQGLIGMLDDLHRGRATNRAWGWVIDLCAGILVLTALAGLTLQLVLRRRRTAAVVVAAVGGALASWIAITTIR